MPTDEQVSTYTYTQQTYEYDWLNRLKSAAEVAAVKDAPAADSFKQSYDYHRWGNRTINAAGTWLEQPFAQPSELLNEKQFDKRDAANTNRLYAPGDTAIIITQDSWWDRGEWAPSSEMEGKGLFEFKNAPGEGHVISPLCSNGEGAGRRKNFVDRLPRLGVDCSTSPGRNFTHAGYRSSFINR